MNKLGWLNDLVALCERLEIYYSFPAHDGAIVALNQRRASFLETVICPLASAAL